MSQNKTTKNAQPEMREIATTIDGRDITRGFVSPMELTQSTDSVLKSRGNGSYHIYREVLRDEQVMSTFQQRRLAVIAREWEVLPASDAKADVEAADFIRDQLKHNIRFDTVTDKMLFGVFYGYAVGECIWAREGNRIVLQTIKVRNRERFGFDGEGNLRLKTMNNPMGEPLPDRKFWSFQTGADHDDEAYGLGLAHWLYWLVFFKRNDLKFWLIFLEKFGQPTATGQYDGNATSEEKTALLQTLRDISTDSGVIFPKGMEIDLLEAARSGTGDYTSLFDRMDKAIAKVVIGQTASSEGTAGRLGNDDLQNDVRLDLIKADADLVCESFNRTVVTWLTEWNYPNAKPPKVYRRVEDPEDLNKVAERDERITKMGYKPTLRHIMDTYGGEYELVEPVVEDEQKSASPSQQFTSFAEPTEQPDPVAELTEQMTEDSAEAMKVWIEHVRILAAQAERLEDLRDAILESYGELPTQQLAEIMQTGFTVASATGRFHVAKEAGQL